mgnify:CR=1 FL=1
MKWIIGQKNDRKKIYKKAIYALARVAVKYIELAKKRDRRKLSRINQLTLQIRQKATQMLNTMKKVVAEINHNNTAAVAESEK